MKKRNKQIAGALFLAGLVLMLSVFYSFVSSSNFTLTTISLMTLGALLLFISQIMCIVAATRLKQNGALWVVFLFFAATIGVPVFLLTVKGTDEI
jgi:hypothetical protein